MVCGFRIGARASLPARSPSRASVAYMGVESIKAQILQVAALTDRGQRLNTLIAPTYQEKRVTMASLISQLSDLQVAPIQESALQGEWELVFSEVELFLEDPRPISWSWRYLHCAAHRTAGQVAGHIAIGHGKRRAERRAAIFAQEDAIDRVLLMIVPWISWVAHA